ncbi:hypothetical protein [Salinicola socius]|uniref:hypothetical protein n=1 Tax=Salinicola socius TaxID=404433 RepID=UPI000A6BDB64|nr:hypothetical protein [Salinicola socius]
MSLLKRIGDRLTGVLGRDCNGKPLRVGDRVVPGPNSRSPNSIAGVMVILGVKEHHRSRRTIWKRAVHLIDADGSTVYARTSGCLLRIDDPELETSWENVTELTGWTPKVVKHPSEVPA